MPEFYVDLHIHSAASPCADNDMTPANIIAMAELKGLDIIALSDHNTAVNVQSASMCAKDYSVELIPAMELNSKEEVHILCYFPDEIKCIEYSQYVYEHLPDVACDSKLFGDQLILDENDIITGRLKRLLISPLDLSAQQIFHEVDALNGVCVFAHIDKKYNSIISNLGFIPPQLKVSTLEVSKRFARENAGAAYGKGYRYITSSDAHTLGDINERVFFLALEEKSAPCLVETFKSVISG